MIQYVVSINVCFTMHAASLIRSNQVQWWSDELSKNQYDGIIGLSQGSAMTALLISMVSIAHPLKSRCFGLVVDTNPVDNLHIAK
jgi:hypothetical protein